MIDTVRLSPSRYRAMPKRHHSSGLGILRAPARRLISGYTGEATKMFESAASDALGKLNLRCHQRPRRPCPKFNHWTKDCRYRGNAGDYALCL
jgi:hypothetical protein